MASQLQQLLKSNLTFVFLLAQLSCTNSNQVIIGDDSNSDISLYLKNSITNFHDTIGEIKGKNIRLNKAWLCRIPNQPCTDMIDPLVYNFYGNDFDSVTLVSDTFTFDPQRGILDSPYNYPALDKKHPIIKLISGDPHSTIIGKNFTFSCFEKFTFQNIDFIGKDNQSGIHFEFLQYDFSLHDFPQYKFENCTFTFDNTNPAILTSPEMLYRLHFINCTFKNLPNIPFECGYADIAYDKSPPEYLNQLNGNKPLWLSPDIVMEANPQGKALQPLSTISEKSENKLIGFNPTAWPLGEPVFFQPTPAFSGILLVQSKVFPEKNLLYRPGLIEISALDQNQLIIGKIQYNLHDTDELQKLNLTEIWTEKAKMLKIKCKSIYYPREGKSERLVIPSIFENEN